MLFFLEFLAHRDKDMVRTKVSASGAKVQGGAGKRERSSDAGISHSDSTVAPGAVTVAEPATGASCAR